MNISEERRANLFQLWSDELSDVRDCSWRDVLIGDEVWLVNSWDAAANVAFKNVLRIAGTQRRARYAK